MRRVRRVREAREMREVREVREAREVRLWAARCKRGAPYTTHDATYHKHGAFEFREVSLKEWGRSFAVLTEASIVRPYFGARYRSPVLAEKHWCHHRTASRVL